MIDSSRRSFITWSPWFFAPLVVSGRLDAADGQSAGPGLAPRAASSLPDNFPSQDPKVVLDVVSASHGNFARVKELVDERPTLALASWDWGFGDWETALGAAAHTGNYDIAEYLIAHGARPTLFSATMMGQLDVVRAFVTATPGAPRIRGPHGITLLRHAMAGRERARPVLDFLTELGGADDRTSLAPLSPEDRDRLMGTYVYGSGATDRFEVSVSREMLMIKRTDGTNRNLLHVGDLAFYPSGAEDVRIRFSGRGATTVVTVTDGPVTVTGVRS